MAAIRGSRDLLNQTLAAGLHERLDAVDQRLLIACWVRVDVATLTAVEREHLLWLVHYEMLVTSVDGAERFYVETTALGRDLVRYIRRQAGRPLPRRHRDVASAVRPSVGLASGADC